MLFIVYTLYLKIVCNGLVQGSNYPVMFVVWKIEALVAVVRTETPMIWSNTPSDAFAM